MVIRLMAHGDFLFLDSPPELPVCHGNTASGHPRFLLLEDPGHVVQEPGGAGKHRWTVEIVHVVKEVLGVLIALGGGQREPADGGIPVMRNLFAQKIELAQRILRIRIPLLR